MFLLQEKLVLSLVYMLQFSGVGSETELPSSGPQQGIQLIRGPWSLTSEDPNVQTELRTGIQSGAVSGGIKTVLTNHCKCYLSWSPFYYLCNLTIS